MIITSVTILMIVLTLVLIALRLLLGEKPTKIREELKELKIKQLPAFLKHSVRKVFSRKGNSASTDGDEK